MDSMEVAGVAPSSPASPSTPSKSDRGLIVFALNCSTHSEMLITGPPTIGTDCKSESLPSAVPWYLASSASLPFFFSAIHWSVSK